MQRGEVETYPYPLPLACALREAEQACADDAAAACHEEALWLADVVACYVGALAVGQYTQVFYSGEIEADPTLNRSLRALRRVLTGQWLLWAARGLAAAPSGPVEGLAKWYSRAESGLLAEAYAAVRAVMVEQLGYTGEFGPAEEVSPRLFLELLDQYRVRLGKSSPEALSPGERGRLGQAILSGLRDLLQSGTAMREYRLYAPQQRKLLMGLEERTPMPPLSVPEDAAEAATLLLYPPGSLPDYTKRPGAQAYTLPLFPLDPLLAYLYCQECDAYQVAALRGISGELPTYQGLSCKHTISPDHAEQTGE